MLEDQDYRCALTGWELTPENCQGDHIVPLIRGGGYGMDNVQLVVDVVNTAKHTMTNEEFIEMCNAVARLHPRP